MGSIVNFDLRYLVQHSRNVLLDTMYGRRVYVPYWSVWKHYNRGIFVTLRSAVEGNTPGATRACVDMYENTSIEGNSLQYVTECTRDCLEDSSRRWNNRVQLEELDNIRITVEILSPRSTCTYYAVTYNQPGVLQLLKELGINFDVEDMVTAADSGALDSLKWLHSECMLPLEAKVRWTARQCDKKNILD